uniref:Uncharacterized protein n=1 Tax=Ditylenchus dipsaci TaxID=166011 RepID=A0A915DSP5_9BILA
MHSNTGKGKTTRQFDHPLLSMWQSALLPFDELIRPEISLSAIRLLAYMIQDAIEKGIKVKELIPVDKICQLIETCIKTPLETKSGQIDLQCNRITEGLRLAEVVAGDEDVRYELLEVVNAPLCSHINESQFVSNP